MTSRDFCYWLQGVLEGAKVTSLNEEQVKIIKNHLSMVFVHEIDPSFPSSQQQTLTEAHNSGSPNFPSGGARC